ncbi:MAG: hypothetical protein Q8R02_02930 [Hyphomonadaceae bacterium]|nr:hypothetical protein [Hyphomonadaceae bacterium]
MKHATLIASLIALGAFTIQTAEAQRVGRGAGRTASGGVVAGQVHDREGPNGGTLRGARGVASDGQGNVIAGSANCADGAAGRACRAGVTERTADGAVTHESGIKIDGANGGTLASQGGFAKDADGNVVRDRTTEASNQNGSVAVDSAYTSETGGSRTVTCANAAGEIVTCPTR